MCHLTSSHALLTLPLTPNSLQVHAWRSYHVQPNPIAMNRAHPGYPPTAPLMSSNPDPNPDPNPSPSPSPNPNPHPNQAPLMSTNYSLSHAGPRDGVGTPDDSGVATRKAQP